jgi:hypothetical protein
MYWFDEKEGRTCYGSLVEYDPIPACMFLVFEGRQPVGDPTIVVSRHCVSIFSMHVYYFLLNSYVDRNL